MKDFRFTNNRSAATLDAVAERIHQPRLWISNGDYPGHRDWADKAIA